jgi:hypothetical protein
MGRGVTPESTMRSWLDPYFAIPLRSPFPIGQSPFRQRGQVYRRNIDFWSSVVPGGLPAICAHIGDPALDRFLSQPFSTSELYDALPSAIVSAAGARIRRIPVYQHLRELGGFLAEHSFRGFSGILLRVLSSEVVATWLPRLSAAYHEFGSVETEVTGPGTVRGVRSGMPRMFVQVWGVTATEITERLLSRSGAASPRCLAMEPEPEGTVGGHEVFRIPFEIRWGDS